MASFGEAQLRAMGWSEEHEETERTKRVPHAALNYATGLQSKTEKHSKYATETWESHLDKTLSAINKADPAADERLIFTDSLHATGKKYTRGSVFKQKFAAMNE